MFDFSDVPFSHGTWPNVTARNETAFGLKDGTKLWETWLGDFFGMVQYFMSRAQIDPNGNVDSASASQIAKAIMGSCGYPGEIVYWGGVTIPEYVRLIPLDGRTLALTGDHPYGALLEAVYCGDVANETAPAFFKYGPGGYSDRDINGTNFKLPEVSGRFIRSIDLPANVDPDGVRLPGSVQVDVVGAHRHAGIEIDTAGWLTAKASPISVATGGSSQYCLKIGATEDIRTDDGGPSISTETRPDNVAFLACIRY